MPQTASSGAATAAITYTIDPAHTTVDFKVRHLMVSNVRGEFSGVSGTVVHDPTNPANSKLEAVIDATTIATRDPQRDAHLKSPDFLDVEKFPKITFVSTKIAPSGEGEWKVTGNLTIHGVTKEVTLNVEGPTTETKDPWGNIKIGASATTKINRKDFGLVWNVGLETGGVLVGDEVTIHLELELAKQA
ncbi:MAG TPA: YceI family protein [Bryobacteraceae bacterium]|jgi:polyisoprenoid-binding protein YceI|nr:YceI family protein [Bryobacteraceae bacterium]